MHCLLLEPSGRGELSQQCRILGIFLLLKFLREIVYGRIPQTMQTFKTYTSIVHTYLQKFREMN